MSQWQKGKFRKKRGSSFNPNRSQINSAVEDFLKKGGKVTKLEADDTNYERFMSGKESASTVDDFLNGNKY